MTCCSEHQHSINTEPQTFEITDFWEEAKDIRTFVFKGTLGSKPGQFCMLWIPGVDEKPFSIARDYDGEIWLTICKVGPATEKLFDMSKGAKVGMRGPFGHGFTVAKKKKIVLVGGGYGTAPLHFTGKRHAENSSDVTMIIGARSADLLIWVDQCEKSGFRTLVATNDGSRGTKGFTTHILEDLLKKESVDLVQTCGPEKMMKAIAQMCTEKGIECEVSIERYMKCGFGVCGQCVTESGEKMCQTGPCVKAQKALSYSDFGVYHRGPEGQKVEW
ncbi:dihydroorotate dehydrogenase electron transfer subunit [Candidatus Gracilibacteria bacterium]|nr:dihydroorotate dehydrogenase electron transfer subunit [Candidatus Gracilibacteria bacterium]MCF7819494.1 dihydroorotate dehydrogenase electron transfer subunit [Candidatus Gracilibacteria bacterium]